MHDDPRQCVWNAAVSLALLRKKDQLAFSFMSPNLEEVATPARRIPFDAIRDGTEKSKTES
jgi:hypothetical protein